MKKNLMAYLPRRDAQVELMLQKKGLFCTFTEDSDHDLVVFTGGSDVTPFLYGQKHLRCTHTDPARDLYEVGVFKRLYNKTPKIGICRGAQFLNVMCGGTLWQDVDRHGRDHNLIDFITGMEVKVSSTHHQMMIPNEDSEVIAMAAEATRKCDDSGFYTIQDKSRLNPEDMTDHEVVYYEKNNALCFQPHPEYEGYKDCHEYFWLVVDSFLFKEDGKEIQVG